MSRADDGEHTTVRLAGASAAGPITLVVLAEGGAPATHVVPIGAEVVLGRAEGCDVVVNDRAISRRHAKVSCALEAGAPVVRVTDLGSANATRVGGRRLVANEPTALGAGEMIQLGTTVVVVQGVGLDAAPAGGAGAAGAALRGSRMKAVEELARRVAASDLSVLIHGETGVGKEVMAEALHRQSPRHARPLLRLNCAAFTETLLDSELFGHERGAFTGAVAAKEGLLESAQGGTVFLDEVGEMPPSLQAKLLRVLEERRVMRVGALRARDIDVRFVTATHRDLPREVAAGRFRQDLYFRINGMTLHIPPLRERQDEIEPLAEAFVAAASRRLGRSAAPMLSSAARAKLVAYAWPGNIRELRNVVERAVVLVDGGVLRPEHLQLDDAPDAPDPDRTAPAKLADAPRAGASLHDDVEEVERRRILDALEACHGNQTRAAQMLGIARGTLVARLARFGVPRPRKR